MQTLQRATLALVLAATLAVAAPGLAQAQQKFPTKPVRIVDAFPPGGGSDVVARLIAPKLTQAWGQQVLVENRGGANGIIGNEHVLCSAPDGYTILIATGSYAANPSLYKLPYEPINDITVIGQVASTVFVVVVHPSVPARSIKKIVATWNAELARITQMQDIKDRFSSGGMEAVSGTPEEFAAILQRNVDRWARVVKQAGIKLE